MDGGPWPVLGGWDDSVTIGRAYHYKQCVGCSSSKHFCVGGRWQTHFSGTNWTPPDLRSFSCARARRLSSCVRPADRSLRAHSIPMPNPHCLPLSESLSFTAYPLSHGTDPSVFHKNKKKADAAYNGAGAAALAECYDSTAFFVREAESGKEMLFFGDVEPGTTACPLGHR